MRYRELKIETQRQAPASIRTAGLAVLVRAGYFGNDSEPTALGQHTIARLRELAENNLGIFAQLGIGVIETDEHEIFFPISTGSFELLQCPSCHSAARRETARFAKSGDATEQLRPLEKVETPDCHTIEALAQYLGVSKEKTAKALMYTRPADGKFVFVVVRGDMQLSPAKLKSHIGEFRPATTEEIQKAGASPGYASPIGLKNSLLVVDDLIPQSANLVAGANQAGYHFLNTNYGRDYSADLVVDLALANDGARCANCGGRLALINTELLADPSGNYIEKIMVALAEIYHNDKGLTLPTLAAPFTLYLIHLPAKEIDTRAKAEELYTEWQAVGIPVLFDDREERAGIKFADADLIGCPLRVTVSERNLKLGMVELKPRQSLEPQVVPLATVTSAIRSIINTPA